MASSRAQPVFRRSEGSRVECLGSPRKIPRPAGKSAGLRNDALRSYAALGSVMQSKLKTKD